MCVLLPSLLGHEITFDKKKRTPLHYIEQMCVRVFNGCCTILVEKGTKEI